MMPEMSRYDTLPQVGAHTGHGKSAADESLRKISSDSGIGISCSQGVGASPRLPNGYEDMIAEPRLATDVSTAMLLAQQQSLSAAALNPAMLGLMSAGMGFLSNPLAAAMLQQEATARKFLETNNPGKTGIMGGMGKVGREQFPMYPGLAQHPYGVPDQLAISEALRSQLLSRKLSEEVNAGRGPVKPTRKANSFSGTSSSPLNRQFSPPTSNAVSPNHSLSPGCRNGDEQVTSPYGDDDSVHSGKSSIGSHTSQPNSQPLASHPSMAVYGSSVAENFGSMPALNAHQFHPSSRKRKNGITGSMPVSDLSSYSLGGYPNAPGDIPLHKLSTASLPASLPSSLPLSHDSLSNASQTSVRKRQRNSQIEEKGGRHEDESYWERRRKNNEAAKRSRDSRRAKEDEIAIRAAFLEQENYKLRLELKTTKDELAKLQVEVDKQRPEAFGTEPSKADTGSPGVDPLESDLTSQAAGPTPPLPTTTSSS
ncbi:uncharacterized protein [Watersipora subatra]|uniref:uncharacterized protein isoform X2 n=1 Tax=Watersipora subatra TaxID=2589382 RepID=UPI00355B900A